MEMSNKLSSFMYQGISIPIPSSIAIDHMYYNKGNNIEDNNKLIFQCDGHNCDICENCLIENICEKTFIDKITNTKHIIRLPELESSNDNNNSNNLKNNGENSDNSFVSIGEQMIFTTESIVISLLWNSIKQIKNEIKKSSIKNNCNESNSKNDELNNHKYNEMGENTYIQNDSNTDIDTNIANDKTNNIFPITVDFNKVNSFNTNTNTNNIKVANNSISNPNIDTNFDTNYNVTTDKHKNNTSNTKVHISIDNATINNRELQKDIIKEPIKQKENNNNNINNNSKNKIKSSPIISDGRIEKSKSKIKRTQTLTNSNINLNNNTKLIKTIKTTTNITNSTPTNSNEKTYSDEFQLQSDSMLKKNISCFGRIRGNSWGCNKVFDNMESLKKHWSEPAGSKCLRRFIELRRR